MWNIGVICLALLGVINADGGIGLFPPNTKVIYRYQSVVSSYTHNPAHFESTYMLHGDLHVTGVENGTIMQLNDVKYSLYNGKSEYHTEGVVKMVDLPTEARDIELPCFAQYDVDGRLMALYTQNEDHAWSKNIKKSIASILQLDLIHLNVDKKVHHAFFTPEQTVHGDCNIAYSVLPKPNEVIVTKHYDPTTCNHFKWHSHLNVEAEMCSVPFDNPVSVNSQRVYHLLKGVDNSLTIKHVEGSSSVMVSPWKSEGEVYSVIVNQTMEMVHNEHVSSVPDVQISAMVRNDIEILKKEYDSPYIHGILEDITVERNVLDMDKAMPKLHDMLQKAYEYLEKNHINMEEPDFKQGQLMNRLLYLMRHFEISHLEHCYSILRSERKPSSEDVLDIFHQLIPHVGTRASALFIYNIIQKRQIKDYIAVNMLNTLPLSMRNPNEKLLKEMEGLLNLGENVGETVRRSGILAFATLIYKTYKHNPHDGKILNTYIQRYFEQMKTTKDFDTQLLYLSGLHNIQIGNVVKYLEPIITGEKSVVHNIDHKLRTLAIFSAMLEHIKDPATVHRIYWPIFVDKAEHLQVRIAAFTVIMSTVPSMDTYMRIYWYMHNEQNEHLYRFYYTTFKSLAMTTHPCYQEVGRYAKKIMRYMHVPTGSHIATGNYMFDYTDDRYGFGAMVQSLLIGGDHFMRIPNLFYFQVTSHVMDVPVDRFAVYMNIEGLDDTMKDTVFERATNHTSLEDVQNILINLGALDVNKPLHIDILILQHNRVIMVKHFNEHTIQNIWSEMQFTQMFQKDHSMTYNSVSFPLQAEFHIPTDMGLPMVISMLVPSVDRVKYLFKHDKTSNTVAAVKFHLAYKQWSHASFDVTTFNPITNSLQGVQHIFASDVQFPMDMDLSYNFQQSSVKLTINHHKEEDLRTAGYRSVVTTMVYYLDLSQTPTDDLHKSCQHCDSFVPVTNGQRHLKKHVLLEYDSPDNGLHHQVVIYNCERPLTSSHLSNLQHRLTDDITMNWGDHPFMRWVLATRHMWAYSINSPAVGQCSFMIRAKPSEIHPVTHMDITMRGYISNVLMQKISFRATCNVKNEDKLVRSWDVNANLEIPREQEFNWKLHVTRSIPNEMDYKICIDGDHHFDYDSVHAHARVNMGLTHDSHCVEDESFIDIRMHGEHSEEQKHFHHDEVETYLDCMHTHESHSMPVHHTLACLREHTSLRHYMYEIHHKNLPKSFLDLCSSMTDIFRDMNSHHLSHLRDVPYRMTEDSIEVEVDYPVTDHDVNLTVHRPHEVVHYDHIPLENWQWLWFLRPYSTHFSYMSTMFHDLGLGRTCAITNESVLVHHNEVQHVALTGDWAMYAADAEEHYTWALFVRKVEDHTLALRVLLDGNTLDIIPSHHEFMVQMNGKMLAAMETDHHVDSLLSYKILRMHHSVALVVRHIGLYVVFDGTKVIIDFPAMHHVPLVGHCFNNVNV